MLDVVVPSSFVRCDSVEPLDTMERPGGTVSSTW